MKTKPPVWLRVQWGGNVGNPDEDDYAVEPSRHALRGRPNFPKRKQGAAPDRWIYDLFIAGMSNKEIGKRCGLGQSYIRERLRQLEQGGYISQGQRLHRLAQILHERVEVMKYVPKSVHKPEQYSYVIRIYKEVGSIMETHRRTGVAVSTVSRWVRLWETRRAA